MRIIAILAVLCALTGCMKVNVEGNLNWKAGSVQDSAEEVLVDQDNYTESDVQVDGAKLN